jgi:hypothetical protein
MWFEIYAEVVYEEYMALCWLRGRCAYRLTGGCLPPRVVEENTSHGRGGPERRRVFAESSVTVRGARCIGALMGPSQGGLCS